MRRGAEALAPYGEGVARTGSDASLEEAGGFLTLKREERVELRGREEGEGWGCH